LPGMIVDARELDEFGKKLSKMGDKILDKIDSETGAQIRELLSTSAKNLAPVGRYSGSGTLRQMIDSSDKGFSDRTPNGIRTGISSNAMYSIYIEYGTGNKGDPAVAHTSKKSWVYFDNASQKFRCGKPQKARHYMIPALDDNVDNIRDLIAGDVNEVFEND